MTFLWGTAVSGHQVEGDNTASDWWDYEGRGLLPHRSGKACDFWNRWREDFDLISRWGHTAFRFSTEWARVEPEPGKWDEAAIQRYAEMARDLHGRGIEPVVTLHHFVLPLWFAREGGFEKTGNLPLFERYCERVVAALAPHARYWITINEPMVYGYQGYALGVWPPFKKDTRLALRVMGNLLEAHARVYPIIHRHRPDAMVSIAKHVRVVEPYRPGHPGDRLAARLQDYFSNESMLRAFMTGRYFGRRIPGLAGSWDYVGLNYYTRNRVRFAFDPANGFGEAVEPASVGAEVSSLGWELYPHGLYLALRRMARYGRPVIVTENGISARDGDDAQRVRYIRTHLDAVERARRDGVRVDGYLYWTLMDNFEWAEG
ncbi:MAG: glycoside hydrolase family 1 protein, partial [Bacillota bacterium]